MMPVPWQGEGARIWLVEMGEEVKVAVICISFSALPRDRYPRVLSGKGRSPRAMRFLEV